MPPACWWFHPASRCRGKKLGLAKGLFVAELVPPFAPLEEKSLGVPSGEDVAAHWAWAA